MSLRTIEIVEKYDSGVQELVEDFYIPALGESINYDRLAGFFTSTSLFLSFRGLENLIYNKGKMRLIVSPKLSLNDIETISLCNENLENYINTSFEEELYKVDNGYSSSTDVLAWLLANNFIEIKIALVMKNNNFCTYNEVNESAIFHQKIGILSDEYGNIVSFSGSVNETAKAWLENNEEFKTFKSWVPGQKNYCESDVEKFNAYWNNEVKNVKVISFPDALKNKLISRAPSNLDLDSHAIKKIIGKKNKAISLFTYQKEAMEKWINSNKRMLFEMATGTGKTRTAIACIQQDLKEYKYNFVIVCTPEETLTSQWDNEFYKLGISFDKKIMASSSYKWRDKLEEDVLLLNIGVINNVLVLATHDTVSSTDFINIINNLKVAKVNTLFVGDEVHGLGSKERKKAFIDLYTHRIGLSATPSRWFDEEGTKCVYEYFENNIFNFGFDLALNTINPLTNKFFLCSYDYLIEKVTLDDAEMSDFIEITNKITKRNIIQKNKGEIGDNHILEEKRANIIKSAKNKIPCLRELLISLGPKQIQNTLIFCSPELIDDISLLLKSLDIKFQPFTKDTGKKKLNSLCKKTERQFIIEQFKEGNIQIILAIKCLDEGIDIPEAERAILVSSTTNPREYIQRIGRVVRQSDNKKKAYIHDFIVTFDDLVDDKMLEKLERNERNRSLYIAKYANNNAECLNELNSIFKGGLGSNGY